MNHLFVLKGQLQQVYAKYSKFIDKAVQFVLAFITFFMINNEVGFVSMLANPVIALGLSVICAFLPPVAMALFAAGLIIAHLYAVSLGVMAVVAIVFLLMFIFYVRFTPKMAIVIILTALAFMFKIPYVLPVACGLLATPICSVPISFGAIAYYTIEYVKDFAAKMSEESNLLGDIGSCAKGVFQNKEMWVTIIAFIICVLVVYSVRRMSMAHAWKVAIAAGVVVNIVFIAVGDMAVGVHASYGALVGGSIAAAVVGFVLEVMFFAVDYSRSETLQYEDDEYYYYVKAVPKITIAAPDKTVKRINSRDEVGEETQIIDADDSRRNAKAERPRKNSKSEKNVKAVRADKEDGRPTARKRAPQAKSSKVPENTEHLLLTQSLERELNLGKKKRK